MDHLPLVSIGVPVYNGEDDLPHAVESLLEQSYPNLEIIISDNASTDRTQQVALGLVARDSRVKYHRLEQNIGANGNFDHVRFLATGEYFMWNGVDDIRPPRTIQSLVEALIKNPQALMAHGPIIARLGERDYHIAHAMDLSSPRAAQRIRVLTARMQNIAMEYGLYRLATLRGAVYANKDRHGNYRYGCDFLICLQMSFLGQIEYVPSPMIVYGIRTTPTASPMGEDYPLTVRNLLCRSRRMEKSWSVLIWGCYYLLRFRQVSIWHRIVGVFSYVSSFAIRYKRRLARDLLILTTTALAAVPLAIRRYLLRFSPFGYLDTRFKNFVRRT